MDAKALARMIFLIVVIGGIATTIATLIERSRPSTSTLIGNAIQSFASCRLESAVEQAQAIVALDGVDTRDKTMMWWLRARSHEILSNVEVATDIYGRLSREAPFWGGVEEQRQAAKRIYPTPPGCVHGANEALQVSPLTRRT